MIQPTVQERLQSAIEATRLNFGLTQGDVRRLVGSAVELGVRAVCLPPTFVRIAAEHRGSAPLELVSVANFPTGDDSPARVRNSAARSVAAGADHVDVVVPGELVAVEDWRGVARFLAAVRRAIENQNSTAVMKVILETAAWDEHRLRQAALAAIDAGARWLKTSTGFHPAGGATVGTVALLRSIAPQAVGIKASGGIRSRESALAMLDAGADRIGTSAEAAILG